MLKEILLGIYINFSSFVASYLVISSLVPLRQSSLEKIIFTYLLHLNNIILILFFLHFIPSGITTTNILIMSQLYLIFSLALRLLRKRPISFPRQLSLKFPQEKIVFILIIILLVDILVNLYSIYIYPPVEPDTLAYHLQAPPNWYQAKNLSFFPSNEQRTMLLADNLNFLSLWLFLSFQSDAFIEIAPYSMLIFGSITIFYFLQTLNNNPQRNLVFSLLYYYGGSYLNFFAKAFTGDVGIAVFTFASLSLLYSYFRQKSYFCFFFFSLSNGLLLGTKISGILCTFLIYVVAFLSEIYTKKRESWRRLIPLYLFSLSICMAIGGFFYFRNIVYFHNPIYGKEINLFNLIHLPGIDLLLYKIYGFSLTKAFNLFFELLKNLLSGVSGYQLMLFYIPAALTLFLFYRKNIDKIVLLIILYPIFYSVLFLVFAGVNSYRYFFSLSLTGIASLAILIRLIRNKKVVRLTYGLVVFFILFVSTQEILSSAIFKSLLNKSFATKPEVVPYYDGDYYFFFNNIPQGATLVYLLPENVFLYPFYGSRYENSLIYANSSDYDEIIQIFKKSKAEYFMGKNPEGDSSNIFFRTDLGRNTIGVIPEAKIYATVAELTKNGILTQIGSGTRINFYKINKAIYDEN